MTLVNRPAGVQTAAPMDSGRVERLLRVAKKNHLVMAKLRSLLKPPISHLNDDQVIQAIATEVARGNMVLREDTGGCDDSKNNRSRFFEQLPGLYAVADELQVPRDYVVGLASYESGWFDDHNVALNNLWGLTQAGHDNIKFESVAAGNAYFVKRVGPHIRSVTTIADFFAGLKKEGYNSANKDYFSMDMRTGMLFNRISNIGKWKRSCGVL